ncbi:MAG: hypothetical protein IPG02_03020 [Ignavibacteria bacterium]|nr:hypothetical protein [Ignavibacteria bacterium]
MKPVVKNILAFVAGALLGSVVNMLIIMLSSFVIPPPPGADVTTAEGLKASMHLFQPRHFIMPFLAHALGTFVGAFIAASIAATHKMKLALGIGVLFLIGGITNVLMLPSPLLFSVIDLALAYIPMAYIGGMLAVRRAAALDV